MDLHLHRVHFLVCSCESRVGLLTQQQRDVSRPFLLGHRVYGDTTVKEEKRRDVASERTRVRLVVDRFRRVNGNGAVHLKHPSTIRQPLLAVE